MATLTYEEQKWVDKVNKLLKKCPSDRIGFFTVGDENIGLYDLTYKDEIEKANPDLVRGINKTGHAFEDDIWFPRPVLGVCG